MQICADPWGLSSFRHRISRYDRFSSLTAAHRHHTRQRRRSVAGGRSARRALRHGRRVGDIFDAVVPVVRRAGAVARIGASGVRAVDTVEHLNVSRARFAADHVAGGTYARRDRGTEADEAREREAGRACNHAVGDDASHQARVRRRAVVRFALGRRACRAGSIDVAAGLLDPSNNASVALSIPRPTLELAPIAPSIKQFTKGAWGMTTIQKAPICEVDGCLEIGPVQSTCNAPSAGFAARIDSQTKGGITFRWRVRSTGMSPRSIQVTVATPGSKPNVVQKQDPFDDGRHCVSVRVLVGQTSNRSLRSDYRIRACALWGRAPFGSVACTLLAIPSHNIVEEQIRAVIVSLGSGNPAG